VVIVAVALKGKGLNMSIHTDNRKILMNKDTVKIYETPRWFYNTYDKKYNFKWDMAASEKNHLCRDFVTAEEDALSFKWPSNSSCWCNPPYNSRVLGNWLEKGWDAAHRGTTSVFLVNSRTDTIWFHKWALIARELHFVKGRITFYLHKIKCKHPATFPSLIIIYTPECTYYNGIADPIIKHVSNKIIDHVKFFPRPQPKRFPR